MDWVFRELNSLQLDFTQLTHFASRFDEDNTPDWVDNTLHAFISTCLRAYKCSQLRQINRGKADTDPGEGFLLLAARALADLSRYTSNIQQNYIGRAACLLKFILGKPNNNNSQAKLEFIRLSLDIGLYSQAFEAYEDVKVKEVLVEPCCPLLFHRLGFLHPFECGSFKPQKEVDNMLKFYVDALSKISRFQKIALEAGNYVQAIAMDDFARRLRDSMVRKMLIIERTRISHITGSPLDEDSTGLGKSTSMDYTVDSLTCGISPFF